MTERELRDLEKLKTTDDYIDEINRVKSAVCETKKADKKIDDTLELLAGALYDKYKYIVNISKSYRKKQGLFSKISDWREERRLKKLGKQAEKQAKEEAKHTESAEDSTKSEKGEDTVLLAPLQPTVEVLDNPTDVKQIEQNNPTTPNPQDGN